METDLSRRMRAPALSAGSQCKRKTGANWLRRHFLLVGSLEIDSAAECSTQGQQSRAKHDDRSRFRRVVRNVVDVEHQVRRGDLYPVNWWTAIGHAIQCLIPGSRAAKRGGSSVGCQERHWAAEERTVVNAEKRCEIGQFDQDVRYAE